MESEDCNQIRDDLENADSVDVTTESSPTAVNSLILDYYKKFGRKRDLEQYFSLSTAHGEVRDPTGLFWSRMKSQNESSDSGDKKSESSTELCRISIKCTVPEQSASSQEEDSKDKSASVSPPIITEDVTKYSDGEDSVKSDNHSQKSIDLALDTSINKPFSPTSSITSQRKLEWDSLADVGYGNESDRKTSASSLSTLERLALKQQYSNNDTKQETDLGPPTAHSTFLDQSENKSKGKKGNAKKTTIQNRDIDLVEVEGNSRQAISVNLTKHISFNVEKDGAISVGDIKKDLTITPEKENVSFPPEERDTNNTKEKNDLSVTPEKVSVETEVTPQTKFDKEIQTTLIKDKETSSSSKETNVKPVYIHKVPVLINLNSLKKRNKKQKLKTVKKRLRSRKRLEVDKENQPAQEKSGAQVSEAESFEYMPGHMYHQNQINMNQSDPKFSSFAGNKSSLESSGVLTTDSSKTSKHSFTKDLDKSIDLLRAALKHRYDDSTLKKKLIKDIVQRLIKSNYRDDDTTTDFLSGLSFRSKKIGLGEEHTTSSTSDGNQTGGKATLPKKSILRLDRFNSNVLASTSQSAPNLPVASVSEKPIISKLFTSSNTESDVSSEKKSSDPRLAKTSSEELYQKYLVALQREETYKRHLKDKENFLRQKLVSSDTVFKLTTRPDLKANSKLQNLLKDLTRNNYDDGSGDASKLEGGASSNMDDYDRGFGIKNQRSHSVFTLSSANSDSCPHRKTNMKKRLQQEMKESKASGSKDGLCQCGNSHIKMPKIDVADSSVQVNIQNTSSSNISPAEHKEESKKEGSFKNTPREDIKYVCLCAQQNLATHGIPPNMYIYKCSRITDNVFNSPSYATFNFAPCNNVKSTCNNICQPSTSKDGEDTRGGAIHCLSCADARRSTQSCQSNVDMAFHTNCQGGANNLLLDNKTIPKKDENYNLFIHEATRSIQTEISINTGILEPCLTDINIVSDSNCCNVVNENFRMISKVKSDNDCNDFPECSAENRGSGTSVIHNKQVAAKDSQTDFNLGIRSTISSIGRTLEKEVQSDIETVDSNIDRMSEKTEDNFKIPIKGTNMTLLVSIGAKTDENEPKSSDENFWQQRINTSVCEATTTDEINVAEKATSLTEECSKGVQSSTTQIFYPKNESNQYKFTNRPRFLELSHGFPGKEKIHSLKKACIVNTCLIDKKANTYPRTVQIDEKKPKPFVRSNTDSGRFITLCYDQREGNVRNVDAALGIPDYGESKRDASCLPRQDSKHRLAGVISEESSKNSCKCKEENELAGSYKSSGDSSKDPIVDIIKDITRRYSKKDAEKNKTKKCFKEIVTVLSYLLDTDDGEQDHMVSDSSNSHDVCCSETMAKTGLKSEVAASTKPIEMVDKGVNVGKSKDRCCVTESSELPSSSDTATCVLNKIKKECEKYHQKKCKSHGGKKKCEPSSSTSNFNQCQRVHYCHCRTHKCKGFRQKATEKVKKKCLAYNLIIQTSDSMVSDDLPNKNCKPLQHIVVKVPKNKFPPNVPFKEVYEKIEKKIAASPRVSVLRSRSCPNESEASSECNCPPEDCTKKCKEYTVRDYLEKNRPDFVERSSDRQNCLKTINEKRPTDSRCPPNMKMFYCQPQYNAMGSMETYNMCCGGTLRSVQNACDPCSPCSLPCGCLTHNPMHLMSEMTRIANERAAQRQLLSLQLGQRPLSACAELGGHTRPNKLPPKLISERDMKKHSEKIYKSLPEVVQKKEQKKKENIKKINLLMANVFKKNLQKNTLRGAVNLSNYSTVIKM